MEEWQHLYARDSSETLCGEPNVSYLIALLDFPIEDFCPECLAKLLEQYRRQMGVAAKMAVVAMTATEISIADTNDSGSMDVAGLDTATPELLSAFARGDF